MLKIVVALLVMPFLAPAYGDVYTAGQNVAVVEGALELSRQWDTLLQEDFDGGLERWAIDNFEDRLTIGLGDDGQTGQCLLITNEGQEGDTAFEVSTGPIPVTEGSAYAFSFSVRSNRSILHLSGHRGKYMTQLQWLGDDAEALAPHAFSFGEYLEGWRQMRVEGNAPPGATAVRVRFGFDHPNIEDAEVVAVDDVRFDVRTAPARYEAAGHVTSRPLFAPGTDRRVSWQANAPPNTSIGLRIASAEDIDGSPGAWSDPVGPDGTPDSLYATGGALPAAHTARPWLRYVASLGTTDASASPTLSSVRIGDVTDGPWSGLDTSAPVLFGRTATRTADAAAPICFSLRDDAGVNYASLGVWLDGASITAQLVREGNRLTYTPAEPLAPPPAEAGFQRWPINNYQGKLHIDKSIRRTAQAPPGLHITRMAGETDTAFRVQSPTIPVEGGQTYTLSYWSRHSLDLTGAMNSGKTYSGGVAWLDENGDPVGASSVVDFGAAQEEWHQDSQELLAADGAVSATVFFGLDSPNITDGAYVDISEVVLAGPRPADPSASQPNLHRITLRVKDFADNELDRTWYMLIRPARTEGIVTVRHDGAVLVDGAPFFPIGLYAVWKKAFNDNSFDKAFRDLRAAGFNTAHTYSSSRSSDFSRFYAAAQRHGVKLYVASNSGANCMNVENVLWDVVREEAQPALLAWYLADDTASHVGSDELRAVTEAIHDVDPAHITVQADGVGGPEASRYKDFVSSTDGFLPELYPIRNDPDRGVPRIIQDMKTVQADLVEAGNSARTVWAIVQYFKGWGWPRYPTRDELWAMSYLSIIHGANGITWYTYGGHGENYGVTDFPEQWDNICALAGEISALESVLVEATGPQPAPPEITEGPAEDALGYASVSILLKEHDGANYLLAANSANATVKAGFAIGHSGEIGLPFEDRGVVAENGTFQDTFGPYGVHVYRWEP